MLFSEEPAWMKKARTIPVRSTWESREAGKRIAAAAEKDEHKVLRKQEARHS